MLHFIKHDGLTVAELYEQLKLAVDSDQGNRKVMIGPTTGGDAETWPLALRVVGIECNDSYETEEFWLYPSPVNEF